MSFAKDVFFFFGFFFSFSASFSNPDIIALLSFKSSLWDPTNVLSSWVNSSNPCFHSWFGVTCNPSTHRVTRLVLENLNLTGSIHPLSQLPQLRLLSLKNNHLSSAAGDLNFSSWPNLKHLYLSHNRLSGTFPAGVSHVWRLLRLDLSYNYFYGEIPITELAVLPRLLTLQLEANSFTGTIDSVNLSPSSPSFSTILEFNVSNNDLSGEIPACFSSFPASSFSGNQNLCGKPLRRECTVKSEPAKPGNIGKEKRMSNGVVLLIVSIDAVAIVAALVTITCCCYYRRKRMMMRRNSGPQERAVVKKTVRSRSDLYIGGYYGGGGGPRVMVVLDGCKGLGDVDDLLKASAELLGKGCVGTTYKVVMDGGDVAVVKRVKGRRRKRELERWLRMIGGLRHCNMVSLRAYYNSHAELLLVYDFLPNGSLHHLLHGNRGPGRTPLEWTTRLKLASGSALGLAYLHGYKKAKLFHGNLTSSNIIVDHLGNACISDIGLHQLLRAPSFSNNNAPYKAPELLPPNHNNSNNNNNNNNNNNLSRRKFTQKCDVYSFGVVLLEILTGKIPTWEGETSLVKWVQRVGREEWTWEVFDFELLSYKEMEVEMVALMQVALLCVAPLPRDRPKMNMVHMMIEDIRTKSERQCAQNSIMNDLSSYSSPSLSESNINFTGSS